MIDLVICSHSRTGKTLSHSRINTVGSTLKRKNMLLKGLLSEQVLLTVTSNEKGSKNENGKVTSPESESIHV